MLMLSFMLYRHMSVICLYANMTQLHEDGQVHPSGVNQSQQENTLVYSYQFTKVKLET